jgi:hypothetical protein
MARGKPWTDTELKLLADMAAQGFNPQQISDSGKFPERTYNAIKKQMLVFGLVATRQKSIVATIQPAPDVLNMEEVVRLFSTAFNQICTLQEVDKLVLERFRIIFHAARDYGPLLAGYERWEKIEAQIEKLAAAVAELQAAKGTEKA